MLANLTSPFVAHHGTSGRFQTFSEDFIRHFGFHVGTREQASHFGRRCLSVLVRISNPLPLPDLGTWDYQSVIREARKAGVDITEGEYDQVFNHTDETKATRRLLEAKGFDGIVYYNAVEGGGYSYIAFRPDQLTILPKQCG